MLETTLNQILYKNQINTLIFLGIMEPLTFLNKYSLCMLIKYYDYFLYTNQTIL